MSTARVGIYPGTFDPITNGHTDIILRATKIVDRLVVGVARNDGKGPLFATDERVAAAHRATMVPDLHALNALEKNITASLGPDVLVPEFTYLSMTEKSEYTQKDDDYALELEKTEGLARGSAESEAKLIAFRERIQHYTHDRLSPVLPEWEYFCFYPMSKRREDQDNWYLLDFAARKLTVIRPGHGQPAPGVTGFEIQDTSWEDHDSLEAEHAAFVASVLDGTPLLASGTSSLWTDWVTEKAVASSAQGRASVAPLHRSLGDLN